MFLHSARLASGRPGVTHSHLRRAAAIGGALAGILCGVGLIALGTRESVHDENFVTRPCGQISVLGDSSSQVTRESAVVGSKQFTLQLRDRQARLLELCPQRTTAVLVQARLISGSSVVLSYQTPSHSVESTITSTHPTFATRVRLVSGRRTSISLKAQGLTAILRITVLAPQGLLGSTVVRRVG